MSQTSILAAARAAQPNPPEPQQPAPDSARPVDILERVGRLEQRAAGKAPVAGASDLTSALAAFVAQHAGPAALDEERVGELIRASEARTSKRITEGLAKLQPREHRITIGQREPVTIEGVLHPAFEPALKRLLVGLPVLLVGPAGTGKTHLAHQLAEALALAWRGVISFTSGTSESALLGRLLPTGASASFTYHATPFVDAFEQGGLVCLDELDSADPNTLGCLNASLANGHAHVPARVEKPIAERHADFRVVATANTWGLGGDREYVGRNQLDAATLDRFRMGRIHVDYDATFERTLVGADQDKTKAQLVERWQSMRSKAREHKLRVVISTRSLLDSSKLIDGAGFSVQECVDVLSLDWNDDTRARIGTKGKD